MKRNQKVKVVVAAIERRRKIKRRLRLESNFTPVIDTYEDSLKACKDELLEKLKSTFAYL